MPDNLTHLQRFQIENARLAIDADFENQLRLVVGAAIEAGVSTKLIAHALMASAQDIAEAELLDYQGGAEVSLGEQVRREASKDDGNPGDDGVEVAPADLGEMRADGVSPASGDEAWERPERTRAKYGPGTDFDLPPL